MVTYVDALSEMLFAREEIREREGFLLSSCAGGCLGRDTGSGRTAHVRRSKHPTSLPSGPRGLAVKSQEYYPQANSYRQSKRRVMLSSSSCAGVAVAHLLFRLPEQPEGRAAKLLIPSPGEFDVGRNEVHRLLDWYDRSISLHHIKIRCVVFDEDDTDVAPMVYVRVLSSNGVLLHRESSVGRSSRRLNRAEGEVLLNQGDALQLSISVSADFDPGASTVEDLNAFEVVRNAETKALADKYLVTPRSIGSGGYSTVVVAIEQPQGAQVACKIVALPSRPPTEALPGRYLISHKDESHVHKIRATLAREFNLLSKLDHPNIVQLKSVFYASYNIYIFQELATAGDLMSYLQMHGERGIDENEALPIAYQLVKAVDYLHRHRVVHRDIKPENILMTSWRAGARVMLTDFGQARLLDLPAQVSGRLATRRMESLVGTTGWTAP